MLNIRKKKKKEKKPRDKNSHFLTEVSKNAYRAMPSFISNPTSKKLFTLQDLQ